MSDLLDDVVDGRIGFLKVGREQLVCRSAMSCCWTCRGALMVVYLLLSLDGQSTACLHLQGAACFSNRPPTCARRTQQRRRPQGLHCVLVDKSNCQTLDCRLSTSLTTHDSPPPIIPLPRHRLLYRVSARWLVRSFPRNAYFKGTCLGSSFPLYTTKSKMMR